MRDWMNGWGIEVQRIRYRVFAWNLMPEAFFIHPGLMVDRGLPAILPRVAVPAMPG